jgi:hypothetical protein
MLPMQLFAESIVVLTIRGCIVDNHHWILAGAREYPSGVPALYPLYPNHSSHLLLPVGGTFCETASANELGYNDDAINNYYVGNYESQVKLARHLYRCIPLKVSCETDFILAHTLRGFL